MKHHNLCKTLEQRLKGKQYVTETFLELEYSKGECDVLSLQNQRFVYYEVKSNHSSKAYEKAKKQLIRWSKYWHKSTKKDCYGVYYTPTYMKIVAKNGEYRE